MPNFTLLNFCLCSSEKTLPLFASLFFLLVSLVCFLPKFVSLIFLLASSVCLYPKVIFFSSFELIYYTNYVLSWLRRQYTALKNHLFIIQVGRFITSPHEPIYSYHRHDLHPGLYPGRNLKDRDLYCYQHPCLALNHLSFPF